MSKLSALVPLALLVPLVAAVAEWGQCGGIGYSGPTDCDSGLTCMYYNDYFSQCIKGGTTQPTSTTSPSTPVPTSGLNAMLKVHGKEFWGVSMGVNCLSISACIAIVKSEYGAITPWDATEPSRGQFNYTSADQLVNWAVSNGKLICAHALVWHSQLPGWVSNINDRNTLTSVIQNHIANVAGRYRGKVHSWVVVHEILNENGSLRSTVFSQVLGESFITIAFQAARAADSTAKLYISDYNLDTNNAKVQSIVALVNRINAQAAGNSTVPRTLIDGIGSEAHLNAGGAGGLQAALTTLASASVSEVAITELDIVGAAPSDYLAAMRACLDVPKCVSITNYGVGDSVSWRPSSTPCLFDSNWRPKPAYDAIITALK
ncbi:hypothetical protein AX16_001180 [Volvariella volvacea WC 439]|nr:hypothetical protein AX16_001180 [Volvariella volvacea WC 439]